VYRTLDAGKLLETSEKLSKRVLTRFPGAGLAEVANELTTTTREAAVRAEHIAQPNIPLRVGLVVLLLLGVAVAIYQGGTFETFLKSLDATRGAAVYLVVVIVFFWTLETRFKRHKALRAIHELRSLTHVIDMHQLAKDPEQVVEGGAVDIGGRQMNAAGMASYLQLCTELLSLVSKIGHLYVQEFPDPPSLNAVDQVETLATGLSHKIWQKIMILDRIRSQSD
jgi:hypothetical protein